MIFHCIFDINFIVSKHMPNLWSDPSIKTYLKKLRPQLILPLEPC